MGSPAIPATPAVPAPPAGLSVSQASAGGKADASASFTKPEINASPCDFKFKLPTFSFGLVLPPFKFPPFDIPIPHFKLTLTCDLKNPIDISASIEPGGGRTSNNDPSPDDDDTF